RFCSFSMHHITLLCIGSLKFSWAKEACQDYADRLGHSLKLELIELPASKAREPEKQREEESERIITALEKRGGMVWVLDERGKEMTSQAFAKELQTAKDRGDAMTFVLGGAYGLNDAVRQKANRLLRLSAMTLPHELCRVVFLEQLYRAQEIGKGSGYHH
ncbi:MAG TPA: 23S rRNA (pseudouridine(1915)-N(3))-methyltransferase RlmH, partial [Candidatus Nanoarchaeia archaeon]|nr:23S rRNA (pseudouridine(1915)-N(3))-methyltransferase RlmH [Candidatus Nanoarchaeia archaeon]